MDGFLQLTVGEVVASDYHTGPVFRSFGIDLENDEDKDLREACLLTGIRPELLLNKLVEAMSLPKNHATSYNAWPIDLLADYVEKKHHRYVKNRIPLISGFLERIVKEHGHEQPLFKEILAQFEKASGELLAHIEREELILFPYIRKMATGRDGSRRFDALQFDSVREPVMRLISDHEKEGVRFAGIRKLTNEFTPPENASRIVKVAYSFLEEFEGNLLKHMYLEEHILFPSALASGNRDLLGTPR